MLKIVETIGNKRHIQKLTRSPNQYPNYKTDVEIESIDKYTGSVVIFDEMLGARNSYQLHEVFTAERHEEVDVFYISQSYFGSTETKH